MSNFEDVPFPELPADERKEQLLAKQALTNISLRQIEAEWKVMRQQSRETTIALIAEAGLSVAEASRLSGHHRNTITTWLQIHNAENSKKLRETKGK